MSEKKTGIVCIRCGREIERDEGFIPGKYPQHAESCKNPLRPEQTNGYKQRRDVFMLQYYADFAW